MDINFWEGLDATPLVLIIGKGGVGRTTLACNLALRGVVRGQKVLHVTIDLPESLTGDARLSHKLVPPTSHYSFLNLRGKECLREYLSMKLPGASAVTALFGSSWIEIATRATPGLQHLVVIGKLVYELQTERWDKILVDLPASGHALEYLTTTIGAHTYFSKARVGGETGLMVATLRDPKVTAVLPITTLEELPVTETIEYGSLLRELALPIPFIAMNECPSSVEDPDIVKMMGGLLPQQQLFLEELIARNEGDVLRAKSYEEQLTGVGIALTRIKIASEVREGLRIMRELA